MTLNDFRMDLTEYLKQNAKRLEDMPPGVFTAVDARLLPDGDGLEPGAIFCLRTANEKLQPDANYPLAPYYLVYVSDAGDVLLNFTHAKRSLDVIKKVAAGRAQPDLDAYERFDQATREAKDMSHYQGLLAKAIAAVTGKAEERGVESLFQRGGTVMNKDSFHGIDDFEVVAYVAVVAGDEAPS